MKYSPASRRLKTRRAAPLERDAQIRKRYYRKHTQHHSERGYEERQDVYWHAQYPEIAKRPEARKPEQAVEYHGPNPAKHVEKKAEYQEGNDECNKYPPAHATSQPVYRREK